MHTETTELSYGVFMEAIDRLDRSTDVGLDRQERRQMELEVDLMFDDEDSNLEGIADLAEYLGLRDPR